VQEEGDAKNVSICSSHVKNAAVWENQRGAWAGAAALLGMLRLPPAWPACASPPVGACRAWLRQAWSFDGQPWILKACRGAWEAQRGAWAGGGGASGHGISMLRSMVYSNFLLVLLIHMQL
jgi:hypothetical protein